MTKQENLSLFRFTYSIDQAHDTFAPGSSGAVFGDVKSDGFPFDANGDFKPTESKYRYLLWRNFGTNPRNRLLWVMLNPSTADAFKDDPTVAKCTKLAKKWGFDSVEVANIFAYRSTDPKALSKLTREEAIGKSNDKSIMEAASRATKIIGGWGAHGVLHSRGLYVAPRPPNGAMNVNSSSFVMA